MNIEIKNCNNIDSGNISLVENKLNIKFAPNGTGKSTIARAIIVGASNDNLKLTTCDNRILTTLSCERKAG